MNKWDARMKRVEAENAILKKHLEKVCTEIDYLLAKIQDSEVGNDTNGLTYCADLDVLWVDGFYQELPITRYSKAEE